MDQGFLSPFFMPHHEPFRQSRPHPHPNPRYRFSVYGDPNTTRYYRAHDGTDIGFPSDDVVHRNFQNMLSVRIQRAKDLPTTTNLVEKVLQRSLDPQPVVNVEVCTPRRRPQVSLAGISGS